MFDTQTEQAVSGLQSSRSGQARSVIHIHTAHQDDHRGQFKPFGEHVRIPIGNEQQDAKSFKVYYTRFSFVSSLGGVLLHLFFCVFFSLVIFSKQPLRSDHVYNNNHKPASGMDLLQSINPGRSHGVSQGTQSRDAASGVLILPKEEP